jgi:hypothetical protein
MRLDEDKLEALRTWGQGLRQADSEELAATGRAILMLVEEIDHLQVELWHSRLNPSSDEPATADDSDDEEPVASSLHSRLRRVLSRAPESSSPPPAEEAVEPPVPETLSQAEADETTSPQAWIEALRRQT